MKKIILSLAIIFAVSYSFGQNGQNMNPERSIPNDQRVMIMPQPMCPVPPVAVYVTQNNNSFPLPGVAQATVPMQKRQIKYIYQNNTRPNVTFITNHNHFADTTKNEVREKNDETCCGGAYSNHAHLAGLPYWFWLLLALVGIILFIAALFYSNRPHNNPPVTPAPVNITNNIPPALKPVVVVAPSEAEIKNALEKAEKTGGTFWRESNGGYRVDFPKPKEEKKETEAAK